MTQSVTQVLQDIPQIEQPRLTKTQHSILVYLKKQKAPKLAKTISKELNLSYDSTRARLHELSKMNLVCQPFKKLSMKDITPSGKVKLVTKCSYMIRE